MGFKANRILLRSSNPFYSVSYLLSFIRIGIDWLQNTPVRNKQKVIVLLVVWSLSAAYMVRFVDRGWIPHDDGALAEMAERVLTGELPHRDFDEIYTGGLSFLYAAAFKVLGANLLSIRFVLLAFSLAFVPVLYFIGLRFASPVVSGAVTLLAVVWSVPNYFAGVPSWYNLFFAAIGVLALIRHIETGKRRWLFVAGFWGGISILVKIVGAYYVAAALLFLTYREQANSSEQFRQSGLHFSSWFYAKAIAFLFFLTSLITLLHMRLGAMEVFHFLIPAAAICGILLWMELKEGEGHFTARFKRLLMLIVPFCLGVVLPIALFLIPYVRSNSLGAFGRGVFVLPQMRLQYASFDFPPPITLIASLPYALLLSIGFSPSRKPLVDATIIVTVLALALSSASNFYVYQVIWQSARSLAVIAVLSGCLLLARLSQSQFISLAKRQMLVLLLIMTALVSLVQFPFPAPIYFSYIAPLVVLTLLAIVTLDPNAPRPLHFAAVIFYFLFALFWTNTGYVLNRDPYLLYRIGIGQRYFKYQPRDVLDLARGGIRVPHADRELYSRIARLAQKHGGSGYIYAAPDCPEVYFLSGLRNPTRKIFDFLGDSDKKPADVLTELERKQVTFVVINRHPLHSARLSPKIIAELEKRFPKSRDLGRFTARWTE